MPALYNEATRIVEESMPELPEAEIVARCLRRRIRDATIKTIWVGRADIVRHGLESIDWYTNSRIQNVERNGKCIVLSCVRMDQRRYLVAELGMTGLLLFHHAGERIPHPQHTHLIIWLDGREPEVRYWNPRRFGRIHLFDQDGLARFGCGRFSVDPMTVSVSAFHEILQGRHGRLKSVLMNQQVFAGIGNIYANEILFIAGLHPDRLACLLRSREMTRLHEAMRRVLSHAIAHGGSSIRNFQAPDGTTGRYQEKHLVYQKEGQDCPSSCGGTIRRVVRERSSFICARCQPAPRRRRMGGSLEGRKGRSNIR